MIWTLDAVGSSKTARILVGLAAMLLACTEQPTNQGPTPNGDFVVPTLVAANFEVGGAGLVLRFSEPVIVPEAIDPSNFRVSLAWYEFWPEAGPDEPEFAVTYRWDPNYYASGGSLNVVGVSPGQTGEEVVLEFDVPIDPNICSLIQQKQLELAEFDEVEAAIGLLPHYALEEPYLEGLDGDVASGFGADWVAFAGLQSEHASEYVEQSLDTDIEIPCVF